MLKFSNWRVDVRENREIYRIGTGFGFRGMRKSPESPNPPRRYEYSGDDD